MTSAATLPCIAFEAVPRALDETLPRMDVAGFVGFALRGPVDLPVLVEDPVAYREVFGPDPELARTADGTPVRAHLGAAVEAFFANGGRRAWVVRAAATGEHGAVTNRFVVPGLFMPGAAADGASGWRAVTLAARSPGAWSDSLTAGATLEVTTAVPIAVNPGFVVLDHAIDVLPGDLLRVMFAEDAALLVEVALVGPDPRGRRVAFDPSAGHVLTERLPAPGATAFRLAAGPSAPISAFAPEATRDGPVVALDGAARVEPGDVLVAESGSVDGVTLVTLGDEQHHGTPPGVRRFRVLASLGVAAVPADWPSIGSPGSPPAAVTAEIQRLRLTVRDGEAVTAELSSLGVGARHARSLVGLPDDDGLYSVLAGKASRATTPNGSGIPDRALTPFERECLTPRFPLAGPGGATVVLPLGSRTDPTAVAFGGPTSEAPPAPTPTRNGLDVYDATLFIDPALAGLGVDTILPTAWDLAHVQQPPRRLRGLHALATVDDVTLVCVPDAVHTGWDRIPIPAPPPLSAPMLEVTAVAGRHVQLAWTPVATATGYLVETDRDQAFTDAARTESLAPRAVVDVGPVYPGPHFFRVQAERGGEEGPRSNVVVAVAPETTFQPCALPTGLTAAEDTHRALPDAVVWRARTAPEARPWPTLRAIQSAVLRWCAARGDVAAVLGLPESFVAEDTLRHVAVLRGDLPTFDDDGRESAAAFLEAGVPALTRDEDFVLGYGAVYHPWLVLGTPGGGDLRPVPPDGGVAGTYAARAASRGAWIAPARQQLAGTLAMVPVLDERRLPSIAAAGVNPVVADPSGFMAATAWTMTDVDAVRPVNVRRLIALLRRLARREGAGIVFEPNDRELQRVVRMRFERFLADMYRRGAFAGAVEQEAFEVSTGDTVNPPEALDSGRFVVEVRVAPSRPLEFITVRLVLAGGRGSEARP